MAILAFLEFPNIHNNITHQRTRNHTFLHSESQMTQKTRFSEAFFALFRFFLFFAHSSQEEERGVHRDHDHQAQDEEPYIRSRRLFETCRRDQYLRVRKCDRSRFRDRQLTCRQTGL